MATKQTETQDPLKKPAKDPSEDTDPQISNLKSQISNAPADAEIPQTPAPAAAMDDGADGARRRMPASLRKYLIKLQGGSRPKFYLPAAYRIVWFRDECPDWGVSTSLIEGGHGAGYATVHALVMNAEGRVISSGMKTESKQDFPAGWVEKAETGAISRALAVAGFGTQFSPELEEDGGHPSDSPLGSPGLEGDNRSYNARESRVASAAAAAAGLGVAPSGEVWLGPGLCPRCHAPEGKRHGKPCVM